MNIKTVMIPDLVKQNQKKPYMHRFIAITHDSHIHPPQFPVTQKLTRN